MNTKLALGLVAATIILAGAFFFSHKAGAPAPIILTPVATTTPTNTPATTSVPVASTPVKQPASSVKKLVGAFDSKIFTTTSSNPRVTGTANVQEVQVVVIDSAGVGIVGGMHIPVVNGRWEFVSSRALAPGSYDLQLGGIDTIGTAKLVVTTP